MECRVRGGIRTTSPGRTGCFSSAAPMLNVLLAFQDVKNLLGIVVLMERRGLAGFQPDHEDFRRLRVGAVDHEVIGVRRKPVTFCLCAVKYKLHKPTGCALTCSTGQWPQPSLILRHSLQKNSSESRNGSAELRLCAFRFMHSAWNWKLRAPEEAARIDFAQPASVHDAASPCWNRTEISEPALPVSRQAAYTNFRWVIVALLFLATSINYIDRQILALLKPILDRELGWTNEQYG